MGERPKYHIGNTLKCQHLWGTVVDKSTFHISENRNFDVTVGTTIIAEEITGNIIIHPNFR